MSQFVTIAGKNTAMDHQAPEDLSHAGSVVDKAIEYMMEQGIAPVSAASALLGGALGLLARSMDDRSIAAVLRQALNSVESGELRELPTLPR